MPKTESGSKFVTHTADLTTTSDTDVYLVPKNFSSHVENFMVSNSAAGNVTFTLKYYEKIENTTHTLLTSKTVSSNDYVNIFSNTHPLFLHAEDKLIVAASSGNDLHVTIAAEEFFDPVR